MFKSLLLAGLLLLSSQAFSANNDTKLVLTEATTVSIADAISEESTSKAAMELFTKCLATKKDLYLILNSPGGSVTAGAYFIDFVNALPCKVHTVTLFAASMAYQIAQNLNDRLITPSGVLMSHRASISGIGGQIPGELISRIKFFEESLSLLDQKAADRVGISLCQYKKDIYDELWMTSKSAIEKNHADKVVQPVCDDTLSGVQELELTFFIFRFKVTLSKCPLITGPLKVEQMGSGQPAQNFNELRLKEIWLP